MRKTDVQRPLFPGFLFVSQGRQRARTVRATAFQQARQTARREWGTRQHAHANTQVAKVQDAPSGRKPGADPVRAGVSACYRRCCC